MCLPACHVAFFTYLFFLYQSCVMMDEQCIRKEKIYNSDTHKGYCYFYCSNESERNHLLCLSAVQLLSFFFSFMFVALLSFYLASTVAVCVCVYVHFLSFLVNPFPCPLSGLYQRGRPDALCINNDLLTLLSGST